MHYFALALISALLFGAATPVSKVLLKSLNPFQLAGLLYLGAALAMLPSVVKRNRKRQSIPLNKRNLSKLTGAVIFGGILGPVLLMLGLSLASAASVSLWLNMELVMTAVLGRLIFKDYLGRFGWLGVLGILLASVLLGIGERAAGPGAGLLVVAACICWGIDNHLTALIDNFSPAQSTFWKGLVAGTTNLGIGALLSPLAISPGIILPALTVGVFSYGLSILLYIKSAQHIGATRSQLVFSGAPFFGVLLAATYFGESLTLLHVISIVLMAVSVSAIFKDRHAHEHQHEKLVHDHSHNHDDQHHNHTHEMNGSAQSHSHWHEHEPVWHSHPHWPDLHHRHKH